MDICTSEILLNLMSSVICSAGLPDYGRWSVPAGKKQQNLKRILKRYMAEAQKKYINNHEAYKVLDTGWFQEYLCQQTSIQDLCRYALEEESRQGARSIYVRELAADVRIYAAAGANGISDVEETALRNFYRMLMRTVQNTVKSLSQGYLLPMTVRTLHGQLEARHQDDVLAGDEAVYLEALTDKEHYCALIEELLELGKRSDWTRREFGEYPWEILEKRCDLRWVAWDFYLNRDEKSIREWMVFLAGRRWEHFASFYIFYWLKIRQEMHVPDQIEAQVRQYYDKYIGSVDIRGAVIWKTDSRMSCQSSIAEMLILFAERFRYDMPKEKARELLFWCPYPAGGQGEWLPARYLTETEIREQVAANLQAGDLKGDVLRWHIHYCLDYHIQECAQIILKIARNPVRNVWVRKDALKYVCSMMEVKSVCRTLLPELKGELFFFAAEQFMDTEDEELAELIWDYGERYPRQKLRCDIYLTFMQNRRGVESLRRHLQRRKGMPKEMMVPGPAEAVREIYRVELADELEKLLQAVCKPDFRDDPYDPLLSAVEAALSRIASDSARGSDCVAQIYKRLRDKYPLIL